MEEITGKSYGKSQNASDFSHEMNDVCNWFSAVSIREP